MPKFIKFKQLIIFFWSKFYEHFKSDFLLWCYFVLFQQICRLYFIFSLSNYLAPETEIKTILYAMVHGLRFDSLWATCWIFISLMFVVAPNYIAQKYRLYLGGVFTFVTALLYITSVEYYKEYKDLFNQFLFGWFYDDKIAILKTIYAQHNVIYNCVLLAIVCLIYIICIKCSGYFIIGSRREINSSRHSTVYKIIASIIMVLFYIISFRGSIGHRPIQLKDAGVTTDSFLNKSIISPYSSLKYAIEDYEDINRATCDEKNLSFYSMQETAKKFFNTNKQFHTFTKYMEKTAKGSTITKPKHIFLIVGESLDSWPLQSKYLEFNLTPNLHKFAASGIHFKYFLSCSHDTMGTLNSIITGIPDTGAHINYQKTAFSSYSTAIASQFKKLGFKPRFFYGGYLSWQNIGDFVRFQDFSEIYGAAHIKGWKQTNEWGVDDRALFEFVANKIEAEQTPTFNIIMTTSNHPPFSIDLKSEGFNEKKIEKLLDRYPNTSISVKELGHIWYSDKTIGEFINKIIAIDSTALFAITGDHFGRKHILPNPPLFDTSAVPLIIYGTKIRQRHDLSAGSHLDLGATLIELVAPKGFVYNAMGENLLSKRKFNMGIGVDAIVTTDFIASSDCASITYFKKSGYSIQQIDAFKERFNQATNIARYIIKKSDSFYDTDKKQTQK